MSVHSARLFRGVVAVPLLAALCACISGPGGGHTARSVAALPGQPACFRLINFDGSWIPLNQRQLLVYAPLSSPPYLLQLFQPVVSLKSDQRLRFEDAEHTGMICDGRLDNVVLPRFQPHRVAIVAVHQITREQARSLMQTNGLKVPRQQAGP
jgi:hypothetical protein